jgi:ubiquinone/menaquinone biosynthesis C-methylase UbiE
MIRKQNNRVWYEDICKYYNLTKEQAHELSARKRGRKPSLPGSKTCQPVSNMTFEELWDMKPRENSEQIFEFYKDVGSWLAIRQPRYNMNHNYNTLVQILNHYNPNKSNYNLLEYGSGVGPVTRFITDNYKNSFHFTLADVPSEPLHFARFRLTERGLKEKDNFNIIEIEPYKFPNFDRKFDLITVCDVFEHCDAPYEALQNMLKYCHKNTIFVETWVEHPDDGPSTGCDLDRDKEKTQKCIKENFKHVYGRGTRIWIKK